LIWIIIAATPLVNIITIIMQNSIIRKTNKHVT
jgi:hypothetical protein